MSCQVVRRSHWLTLGPRLLPWGWRRSLGYPLTHAQIDLARIEPVESRKYGSVMYLKAPLDVLTMRSLSSSKQLSQNYHRICSCHKHKSVLALDWLLTWPYWEVYLLEKWGVFPNFPRLDWNRNIGIWKKFFQQYFIKRNREEAWSSLYFKIARAFFFSVQSFFIP